MKTSAFILSFFLASCEICPAATLSRLVDGRGGRRIEFAKYMVGQTPAFNDVERDLLLKAVEHSQDVAVPLAPPSAYEVVVASGPFNFKNNSDYEGCAISTAVAGDKIDDLLPSEAKAKAVQIQVVKDAIAVQSGK